MENGNEPAAYMVPINELNEWEKNPRVNDAAVDKVAASIRRFGFGSPIVARKEDSVIIAGHTRIKAARTIEGMTHVPVRYLDISMKEAEALALADNKLGEIAVWEDNMLASLLLELEIDEAKELGWNEEEFDYLISSPEELWEEALGGLAEGDRAPFQTMTFTFHDNQAEKVNIAIKKAQSLGDYSNFENENKNGNAIYQICLFFLEKNI